MKHIAVVSRPGTDISLGNAGAWTAFIGEDQEEVIQRALEHKKGTGIRHPEYTYTVYIGTLTHEAQQKNEYTLRRLRGAE